MNIDVTQAASQRLTVVTGNSVSVEVVRGRDEVSVGTGLPQQNLFVGPNKPAMSGPGIWIQTMLGDGSEFEIWFEDGK